MAHFIHPITGRQDKVRTDADWRARIERIEKMENRIICGAKDRKTGEPCTDSPLEGGHRCKRHTKNFKSGNGLSKYPPNVGYGMNLMQFAICRRCGYRDGCPGWTAEEDDECKIEQEIYDKTMQLKDTYTISGDYIQTSMLESVAFLLIHRFRAQRAIAQEGMVLNEVVGAWGEGNLIKNKKPHPLLKHVMDIDKQLNMYAKTMEFSPEAIHRRESGSDVVDAGSAMLAIFKRAQEIRVDESSSEQE